MQETYLVTGAAGFIGSHVCDFLLSMGHKVVGIDNFSTGRIEFLSQAKAHSSFQLVELDLLNAEGLKKVFLDVKPQTCIHLAANADVRFGLEHPSKDIHQNILATFNVLEACRAGQTRKIGFSSTGSIYGEATKFPTPENYDFPIQTSIYGASKLAGEGLLSAYAEGFGIQAFIFRFVSIVGERYTHGHIFDFTKKLLNNPEEIHILGNGQQQKAYLYIGDCVNAIWTVLQKADAKVNIFNLGPDEYINVNQSLDTICDQMKMNPRRTYSGGERGWVGDSPFIFLDAAKLKSLGWKPTVSIRDGVRKTVNYLLENKWVLQARNEV